MMRLFSMIWLLLAGLACGQLKTFHDCAIVGADWADGDSFPVKFPDGQVRTIRLYGVDCMEIHVQGDDSNARRLRDQRRYFGIKDILVAKSVGEAARDATRKVLEQPFVVHTSFADGRGDGRFERVYAFVTAADGRDLSEWLVEQGLARAFGVVRQRPDGTRGEEWRAHLSDLELTAARAGLGAWKHTDWKGLPEARRQAREEGAEIEAAKGVRQAAENDPVDVNTAARDVLMTLPGVGEKTADAIIGGRPYAKPEDLLEVEGIGRATLTKLKPFIRVGRSGAAGGDSQGVPPKSGKQKPGKSAGVEVSPKTD